MAKRRTEKGAVRAAQKLARQQGQTAPSGRSRYAMKRRGEVQPQASHGGRPSWFVRSGLASIADRQFLRLDLARQQRSEFLRAA
jgi:hypothetical protein